MQCKQKRSCEVVGSLEFLKGIQVCVGEDLAFHMVDLTFQGQSDLLQVRRQPPCSGGLACLGSRPGLANCTGASIEGVIVARCTGCSSKLCLLFDPFQPGSLQQTRCPCRLSHLSPDLYSRRGCTRITTLGQQ